MAVFSFISLRRLIRFWEHVKEYIDGKIQDIIQPESEKEVVSVLTCSDTAPEIASDGDYYINTDEPALYVYDDGEWVEDEPSESVIYIALDTSHIYVWNGSEFVDSTGDTVDNTIYVHNLTTALEDYKEPGLFSVCLVNGTFRTYYTMTVSVSRRMMRPSGSITYYNQTLHNNNGYQYRTKVGSGDWSDWTVFEYVSQEQLQEVSDLAAAGCVL